MNAPASLRHDEEVVDRAFAHPDHIPADRSVLGVLLRDVGARLPQDRSVDVWVPDPHRWHRHVMIPDPTAFGRCAELTVVGFFGRRRDGVPTEVVDRITEMSRALEKELPSVPGVLSYTTSLLVDEVNYANLVLMDCPETIETWRHIRPHPTAAGSLSASYYDFVRIYHGSIPTARIGAQDALRLHRVRYWDFRAQPVWSATRELML